MNLGKKYSLCRKCVIRNIFKRRDSESLQQILYKSIKISQCMGHWEVLQVTHVRDYGNRYIRNFFCPLSISRAFGYLFCTSHHSDQFYVDSKRSHWPSLMVPPCPPLFLPQCTCATCQSWGICLMARTLDQRRMETDEEVIAPSFLRVNCFHT